MSMPTPGAVTMRKPSTMPSAGWPFTPCASRPDRALMCFYAWSGDRTAGQQQYQECVRILAAELGIAPDPETTALYGQIRAGNFIEPGPLCLPPRSPTTCHPSPRPFRPHP